MNSPLKANWFYRLQKGTSKYVVMAISALLAVVMTLSIFQPKPAAALDEIKLMYGPASISIAIPELVEFANTGTQSEQLRSFFLLASATPEQIETARKVLSYSIEAPTGVIKSLLDNTYAKLAIGLFSRFFAEEAATVSRVADELSAAVTSLSADGRISLLEVIQNYSFNDRIVIKLDGLVDLYQQGVVFFNAGIDFLKEQPTVQKLICS